MEDLIAWLLEGPPWVRYRARLDLAGEPEDAPQVMRDREAMLTHPRIKGLVAELQGWPGPNLKRHKDAKHPLHKLTFLADLGLRIGDCGVEQITGRILSHQSREGPFQVLVNIPPRYGGTGQEQWAWMLCDAAPVVHALLKLGCGEDPRVQAAVDHLRGLIRENGWPCVVCPELGKFRGPGRKGDPCPYANLLMLRALSQLPDLAHDDACRTGAETALCLWEQRKKRRPYMFGMGTDFAKLKAPLIWYDILHVLDVLTRFAWLREDERLLEMAQIVQAKADEEGRFTPESVWRAWKEWDFGQKRDPSRWLSLLTRRTLDRIGA